MVVALELVLLVHRIRVRHRRRVPLNIHEESNRRVTQPQPLPRSNHQIVLLHVEGDLCDA